jgi:hypothetical protein
VYSRAATQGKSEAGSDKDRLCMDGGIRGVSDQPSEKNGQEDIHHLEGGPIGVPSGTLGGPSRAAEATSVDAQQRGCSNGQRALA